eukprot:TRINITY_DN93661_c0_g1_i1.p1 TRINITY_DN93661_c0_g1~~TRINITY_DN93661_c0_g1_i1.p1  ORF type:complete len:334 (+),score=79.03 TRINITY_DN93661_c0_g1_i1:27-1004(+)
MAQAWSVISHIVSETEFQQEIETFVESNCDAFEDVEENKLEYTSLHDQYTEIAERRIESKMMESLGPTFDMVAFLLALPDFLETGQAGNDDESNQATLEVLSNFNDFQAFKSMMIARKKAKEAAATPVSPLEVALTADLESFTDLLSAGNWETVKSEGWMIMEKADINGEQVWRTTLELDMSPAHAYHMMMVPDPDRALWDSKNTIEEVGENSYTMKLKMPMLPTFTFNIKVHAQQDFPTPGDITWVYRGFDPATGEVMTTGGVQGKGCARAVEGNPNKCLFVSIESMPAMMSYMPSFMVKWMVSYVPKMTIEMASKYKKHKGLA